MVRPRLDADQTAQALNAYVSAREQAVRYVLSALDPTALDAPARPYLDVLARVYDLIAAEIDRYAAGEAEPQSAKETEAQEAHPHG